MQVIFMHVTVRHNGQFIPIMIGKTHYSFALRSTLIYFLLHLLLIDVTTPVKNYIRCAFGKRNYLIAILMKSSHELPVGIKSNLSYSWISISRNVLFNSQLQKRYFCTVTFYDVILVCCCVIV